MFDSVGKLARARSCRAQLSAVELKHAKCELLKKDTKNEKK